jgi:hypothetical protein
MTSEQFIVRRAKTAEEVRLMILERTASEDRRPGALDHESFFAADETGFYVGELDGQAISSVSVVKYSDNYAFVGQYLVNEGYRGRGYGLKTWKTAMASLHDGYNIGLETFAEKEYFYEGIGYKHGWFDQRFEIAASQAAAYLSGNCCQPSSGVHIQPASKVDFNDIFEYDTSVYVFPRKTFLTKWISASNSRAFVATDNREKVVGYIVVRSTLKQEDRWKIGPLFADNSQVARSLYRAAFAKVAAEDSTAVVIVDVPYGAAQNPDALQIAKEMSPTPVFTAARMYSKGVPSGIPMKKIFAITSVELG